MKVKDLSEEKKEFQPIKLELTFETEEEVLELWHRLNASRLNFYDYYKQNKHEKCFKNGLPRVTEGIAELWGKLRNILKEREIL